MRVCYNKMHICSGKVIPTRDTIYKVNSSLPPGLEETENKVQLLLDPLVCAGLVVHFLCMWLSLFPSVIEWPVSECWIQSVPTFQYSRNTAEICLAKI